MADGKLIVDLLRIKMDLEALRRATNQAIDSIAQQVDALLPEPEAAARRQQPHWSETIDQW